MFGKSRAKEIKGAVVRLSERAQEAMLARKAVALQAEAIEMARQLGIEEPADLSHTQALASLLYTQGSYLTSAGLWRAAIEALDEAERLYGRLRGTHPRVDAWIADVHARRGLAYAAGGAGASAVIELQSAVMDYRGFYTGRPNDPHYLDMARIMATNADVLAEFGDPDLAVASADASIAMYLQRVQPAGFSSLPFADISALLRAVDVAVAVHEAQGRPDVARQAGAVAEHYRSGRVAHRCERPFYPPSLVLTVAAALDKAGALLGPNWVSDELRATVGWEGQAATRVIPTDRRRQEPERLHELAITLAELAMQLPPQTGMRLGLEAHYLFAGASRLQNPSMRYDFGAYGPTWARLLLKCSRQFSSIAARALALDLSAWAATTAIGLIPFMAVDPEARQLVKECIRHHGQMLIENARKEGGESLKAANGI